MTTRSTFRRHRGFGALLQRAENLGGNLRRSVARLPTWNRATGPVRSANVYEPDPRARFGAAEPM